MNLLTVYTMVFSALFWVAGLALLISSASVQKAFKGFLRSKKAAALLAGVATGWFVWVLYQLGPADFGDFKGILILIFGGAGLLSFFYLDDFLSVRGLAVILLLLSRNALDAAYMQEPESRLVLVSIAYITVAASLYFGSLPYRLRDFFDKIFSNLNLARTLGGLFVIFGAALDAATAFYFV